MWKTSSLMNTCRIDYTATVAVLVGPEEEMFIIYEHIFTARSTFFRAPCSGTWNEEMQDLKLPDDDPATFNNYLACVLSGGVMN
nr:hypothetical protein CFP56_21741 [Quercus suber]